MNLFLRSAHLTRGQAASNWGLGKKANRQAAGLSAGAKPTIIIFTIVVVQRLWSSSLSSSCKTYVHHHYCCGAKTVWRKNNLHLSLGVKWKVVSLVSRTSDYISGHWSASGHVPESTLWALPIEKHTRLQSAKVQLHSLLSLTLHWCILSANVMLVCCTFTLKTSTQLLYFCTLKSSVLVNCQGWQYYLAKWSKHTK